LTGGQNLRLRLILSTLAGKSLKISEIRSNEESPGLRDYEASLLRLLDKISNGVKISINETGTTLRFLPGELIGGEITHDCPPSRSVVYFLEFAAVLAPFCKTPLRLRLRGVTQDASDNSVDSFKTVTLAVITRLIGGSFSTEQAPLSLEIERRGVAPSGAGSVLFVSPIVPNSIAPINFSCEEGRVKRVRGVAWTSKVSTQFSAAVIDAARSVLNPCPSDVWIYTDAVKGAESEGYGLSLVAETDSQIVKGSCGCRGAEEDARNLGLQVAQQLLAEIENGGLFDSSSEWLVCLFMAVSADFRISRSSFGSALAPYTIECMRLIREFTGVRFKITALAADEQVTLEADGDATPEVVSVRNETFKLECIGANIVNSARRTF